MATMRFEGATPISGSTTQHTTWEKTIRFIMAVYAEYQ